MPSASKHAWGSSANASMVIVGCLAVGMLLVATLSLHYQSSAVSRYPSTMDCDISKYLSKASFHSLFSFFSRSPRHEASTYCDGPVARGNKVLCRSELRR